jgi:opacity protein-like surface antigen
MMKTLILLAVAFWILASSLIAATVTPTVSFRKLEHTGRAGAETATVVVLYMSDGTVRWEATKP